MTQLIFIFLFLVNFINLFTALVCPIYSPRKTDSQGTRLIKTCGTNCQYSNVLEKQYGCFGLYYNVSGIIHIKQLAILYSDQKCLLSNQCILDLDPSNSQTFSCCCITDNCTLDWQITSTTKTIIIATTTDNPILINDTIRIDNNDMINNDRFSWELFFIVFLLIMIIILITCALYLLKSWRNKDEKEDEKPLSSSMESLFFSAQELHTGKISTIYKATFDHDIVTLKVYNQSNLLSWQNEVTLLKSIKHESIIRILSEGQYDAHLYLILPFYENGTLQSYLHTSKRTLSMDQCLVFLRSLASAISYLHMGRNSMNKTIVHRDIKSSNILIGKNEFNLYLTDFGIAMALPNVLTDKDFVQIGTMRYMAPELLEGVIAHTREALCSVDMYALALVMWEILTQCEAYPTTEYCLPYEEYRTNSSEKSSFPSEIYDIVVVRRLRPTLIRPLNNHRHALIVNELCSLIDACWITDSDMRMNAQALAFKLNQQILLK